MFLLLPLLFDLPPLQWLSSAPIQNQATGFQTVLQDLASFQATNGGFSSLPGETPTLESTANALYLSTLYGLHDKVCESDGEILDPLTTEDGR